METVLAFLEEQARRHRSEEQAARTWRKDVARKEAEAFEAQAETVRKMIAAQPVPAHTVSRNYTGRDPVRETAAAIQGLLDRAKKTDQTLCDPHDDGSGRDAIPPEGQDWSDLYTDVVATCENVLPRLATASALQGALQWLLDDMNDADETHGETGEIFDSVEEAAAALVEAGGFLSWYTPDQAAAYRAKQRAEAEEEEPPVDPEIQKRAEAKGWFVQQAEDGRWYYKWFHGDPDAEGEYDTEAEAWEAAAQDDSNK